MCSHNRMIHWCTTPRAAIITFPQIKSDMHAHMQLTLSVRVSYDVSTVKAEFSFLQCVKQNRCKTSLLKHAQDFPLFIMQMHVIWVLLYMLQWWACLWLRVAEMMMHPIFHSIICSKQTLAYVTAESIKSPASQPVVLPWKQWEWWCHKDITIHIVTARSTIQLWPVFLITTSGRTEQTTKAFVITNQPHNPLHLCK